MNDSWVRLPEDTPVITLRAAALRLEQGRLVLADERAGPHWETTASAIHYPHSSVHAAHLPEDVVARALVHGHFRWPVVLAQEGLWMDPQWSVFSLFFPEGTGKESAPTDAILDRAMGLVEQGALPWDLDCPSLPRHGTFIGHLMAWARRHMAGDPAAIPFRDAPLFAAQMASILERESDTTVQRFLDRGWSLLDLACRHHHWALAESLWQRGVRWGPVGLDRAPVLEALIEAWLALRQLQGPTFLDKLADAPPGRAAWFGGWLERAANLPVHRATCDFRERLEASRGNVDGRQVRDTPPALWISQLIPSGGGVLRRLDSFPSEHRRMLEQWLDFWTDRGVDLDEVVIDSSSQPTWRQGLAGVFADSDAAAPWVAYCQARQRLRRMDQALEEGSEDERSGRARL